MKGIAIGLGIKLHAIGNSLCITVSDFARLKKFVGRVRIPYGSRSPRARKPEPEVATV